MNELDDILSEEVAETIEQPEAQPELQPRDESGKFAPKGEPESESPAPAKEPEFDHQAVIGERRRRQEAEAANAQLMAQLQALQNPPQPAPDMFEAPEDWQSHFGEQLLTQATSQAAYIAHLNMSEMLTRRDNKEDFDEMKALFLSLAEENPSLGQQANNDPDPWGKAYQIAKNHKAMQELGATDITQLEAKLREKIQAELAGSIQQSPTLPNSLADAQSARSNSAAPPARLSLNDILGG